MASPMKKVMKKAMAMKAMKKKAMKSADAADDLHISAPMIVYVCLAEALSFVTPCVF